MEIDDLTQPTRASCLPVMLGCGTIGFMGLLLTVATGGGFLWFAGALVLLLFFGAMHYLLWGHLMSQPPIDSPTTEEASPPDERITGRDTHG